MEVRPNSGSDLEQKFDSFGSKFNLKIPKGDYYLSGEMLATGTGESNPTKTFILHGAGVEDTRIYPAQSSYGIRGVNGPPIYLKDLQVISPASNALPAFYGDDAGACKYGLYEGGFENVKFRGGGSTSDHWLVHLKNPYRWFSKGFVRMTPEGVGTDSGGLLIENTDGMERGDGIINGYFNVYLTKDNQTCIFMKSTSGTTSHVIAFGQIFLTGDASKAATVGLKVNNCEYVDLRDITSEGLYNIVQCVNARYLAFGATWIGLRNGGTGFSVDANCYSVTIDPVKNMYAGASGAITALNDAVASLYYPTIARDWLVSTAGATINWSLTDYTNLELIRTGAGCSERRGVATILNGTDNAVVNHGLLRTPTLSGIEMTPSHAEVVDCRIESIGAAQFTIKAPGVVSANRDVGWRATTKRIM
jgi:hypothetical protein